MNVDEYGNLLRFNVKEDISSATKLELLLRDIESNESTVTPTLGTSTISTDVGEFTANQYVEYTFQAGDIDDSGVWWARVVATFADKKLKSDWKRFRVKP